MTDTTARSPRHTALRISAIYLAVGALLVAGMAWLASAGSAPAGESSAHATWLQGLGDPPVVGSALLVLATGLLLYVLMLRSLGRARAAEEQHRQAQQAADTRFLQYSRKATEKAAEMAADEAARTRLATQSLEGQLRQARKLETMGLLAGGVAHDFNNLLGALTGYSELALSHLPPDHPARGELDGIREVIDRGAGLTRQLLALSRRQVLHPAPLDLNAVLVDLGRMLPRVLGGQVEVTIRSEAHPSTIMADLSQIEQLVLNLCVNARDAMPQGGRLLLQTEIHRPLGPHAGAGTPMGAGRRIALIVSDTGNGMDAATRERIFEPFFSTKQAGAGTGLGLATVFAIVQQSGGTIACSSSPGRGTSFRIEFPVVSDDAGVRRAAPLAAERDAEPVLFGNVRPAVDVPIARGAAAGAVAPATAAGSRASAAVPTGITVLVMDDDALFCCAVSGMLQADGHSAIVASDGAAGLAMLRTTHVDVVLCDMLMPEKEGLETCTEMHRQHPGLPFIAMSGAPGGSNYLRIAVKLGASGSLAKPFSRQELNDALDHALAVGQG